MPRLVFLLWTRLKNVGESSRNLAKYMNFSSLIATPWLFENNCFQIHIMLFWHGSTNRLARCSHPLGTFNFESVLVEKDCLFTFIIFHGKYLTHKFYKWSFQKIMSNFELVMNFGRFGQTRVLREFVNSVWKFKCCFLVTIWCTMHHTTMHVLFTYIWC